MLYSYTQSMWQQWASKGKMGPEADDGIRRHGWQVQSIIAIIAKLLQSMLPFRGLSVAVVLLKRLKISTRFLLRTTAPCLSLSQTVLKFGLHRSTPSSPKFAPELSTPLLI